MKKLMQHICKFLADALTYLPYTRWLSPLVDKLLQVSNKLKVGLLNNVKENGGKNENKKNFYQ